MTTQPIKTLGDGVVTTTPAAGSTTDVNLAEVLGTATNVNGGNRDAGTQTVTLADDDPAVTDLDTIAGDTTSIDGKTPALGAAATAASVPVNIANDQDVQVQGDIAHDAVDSGNPVKIGGHARTSQRAAVATDDRADIVTDEYGQTVPANFVWADRSGTTTESDPLSTHHDKGTLADVTDGADGTYYYYVDMDGYKASGYQLELNGGSGTVTVTVEGTLQDDGTAQASCTYQDVTSDTFGSATITATDMLIDNGEKLACFKFVRIKVVAATGAADDADWAIYFKDLY